MCPALNADPLCRSAVMCVRVSLPSRLTARTRCDGRCTGSGGGCGVEAIPLPSWPSTHHTPRAVELCGQSAIVQGCALHNYTAVTAVLDVDGAG